MVKPLLPTMPHEEYLRRLRFMKPRAGSVAAAALAVLSPAPAADDDGSSDRGDRQSRPPPGATDNNAARAASTPAPVRFSPSSRRGKRTRHGGGDGSCEGASREAILKQKIRNYARHSSPASSVASRQSNIAGRSPSNSIASAQTARANNLAGDSRTLGLSMPKNGLKAAGGMRAAVAQNADRSLLKREMCSPHCTNGYSLVGVNGQRATMGDPGGSAPSGQNGFIDLTGDDSGEEPGIAPKPWAAPPNENRQTMYDRVTVCPSAPGENQEKANSASMPRDMSLNGNHLILNSHVMDRLPNQVKNKEKPSSASKSGDMPINENRQSLKGRVVDKSSNQGHEKPGDAMACGMAGSNSSNGETLPMEMLQKALDRSNEKQSSELEPSQKKIFSNIDGQKKDPTSPKRKTKKKAPAKSPVGAPSYSLTGTLTYVMKDGHHCHIMRGLWDYENQPESTPQRFFLRRDIPSDVESMPPLTSAGSFSGSFVYQCTPKGQPKTNLVIKESDVNISFTEQEGELQSFILSGTGHNDVGIFDLVGTATKVPSREIYNINMRKQYTEMFRSQVSPPAPSDDEQKSAANNRKRKFSMLDASAGSETETFDDRGEEGKVPRAVSTSSENSATSRESNVGRMIEEVGGGNAEREAMAPVSTQPGDKVVLDVVRAESVRRVDRVSDGKYKYGPMSKLSLSPEKFSWENDVHTSSGSWREFGSLRGMASSLTAAVLTWNVRNVKPKYSQMNLDFFSSVGIIDIQDLLEADTDTLSLLLLAFNEFKAACAFAAWKSRIHSERDPNVVGHTFYDYYRPLISKKSIVSWKEAAGKWYEKMAGAESYQTNSMQVSKAASAMDAAVFNETQVQPGNNLNLNDSNVTPLIGSSSEMVEGKSDNSPLLENIISSREAYALKNHCNINTARQLLKADREDVIKHLTGIAGAKFRDRPQREVECIVEGMLYSWLQNAQDALQKSHSAPGLIFSYPTPRENRAAFQTPLGYVDLHFLKAQRILSDEQLAKCDPSFLAQRYVAYAGRTHKHIDLSVACEVANKWRHDARLALGMSSQEDICDSLPPNARLDKDSGVRDAMVHVPNLCKTETDEKNDGLPRRTIFTYDRENYVLYEFLVTVKDSLCSSDAGYGAFLTFQGAKVLKASSKWKRKDRTPGLPQTRRPLDAVFPISGATVSLKGDSIHGDEHHYGPERDDSVGLYREFTLDDFVDAEDNISFSSKHLECALIELDRYAPLLPEDRKTDLCFAIKDFIFSHEPSSWRFDVQEVLNGRKQVVDFTSDTTGAPHDVAQSHMPMYVNEVGHNADLVENVRCLETSRSVSYYIHIDKPMVKGDTTELLVNYMEHYETMRERRGYGKANLLDGIKSDAHNISRVQRNLKDRFLTEESIMRFTEDEIRQVIEFITSRVFEGVKAATSTLANRDSNLLRQCIARRRMGWLSSILRTHYYELLERRSAPALLDSSYSEGCIFQKGMYIFVHDWPKNDPRPAYTGLATITAVSKDKYDRPLFEVELADGKYIESVPEAVVTVPTDDDFKGVPKRTKSKWMKWKKEQEFPRTRDKILKGFHTIEWDGSFVRQISAEGSVGSPFEVQASASILQSLRWEVSEEILFLLSKNKRLSRPFDEELWCPLSVQLLTKCLHSIADFLLMGRDKQTLRDVLFELAHDASNTMKHIVSNVSTNQQNSLANLAFQEKSTAHDAQVLVIESVHVNRLTVEDYVKNPQPLDLEWYLTHQIFLPVHSLASMIDWGLMSGTVDPLYSIEKLFDAISLRDASYLNYYMSKVQDWHPLL